MFVFTLGDVIGATALVIILIITFYVLILHHIAMSFPKIGKTYSSSDKAKYKIEKEEDGIYTILVKDYSNFNPETIEYRKKEDWKQFAKARFLF